MDILLILGILGISNFRHFVWFSPALIQIYKSQYELMLYERSTLWT
jgi:hypothetical protein